MRNIDYLIWIVVFAAILVCGYFLLPGAGADDISEIENRILDLSQRIPVQKQSMIDAEKAIKTAEERMRQVKKSEGKSWDFLPDIAAAQTALDISVQVAKEAREKYFALLIEKSNEIKNLKLLREEKKKVELKEVLENVTESKIKLISVTLSKKCLQQVKANITTLCPSYKDLRKYDSSKQEVSGYFVAEPYYHRNNTSYKDSWRYYDHDMTPRIIVDPPLGMSDRFGSISIESGFDTFLRSDSKILKPKYTILNLTKSEDAWGRSSNYTGSNRTVSVQVSNETSQTIIYHDRFVDSKCKNAVINAAKWQFLLPDTIKYLQSGCLITAFDNTEIVIKNYTVHDITTTGKYQLQKWVDNIGKEYKIGKDNSTNKSVTEDKMPKYKPKVHQPYEY